MDVKWILVSLFSRFGITWNKNSMDLHDFNLNKPLFFPKNDSMDVEKIDLPCIVSSKIHQHYPRPLLASRRSRGKALSTAWNCCRLLGDSLVLLGFTGGFPGKFTGITQVTGIIKLDFNVFVGGFHFSLNRNAWKVYNQKNLPFFHGNVMGCLSVQHSLEQFHLEILLLGVVSSPQNGGVK